MRGDAGKSGPTVRAGRMGLAALVALVPVSMATGQPGPGTQPPARGSPSQPRPVEQGVGDLNPLQISNRLEPLDLRRPTGWERVYRLNGVPGRDGGRGLFARFDGGIAAVFPWSSYESTRRGAVATVPAGTKYYIGVLPESLTEAKPAEEPEASFNYLDRSARAGQPERPVQFIETAQQNSARPALRTGGTVEPSAPPAGPSIWTSEAYRRARLEELLARAAK